MPAFVPLGELELFRREFFGFAAGGIAAAPAVAAGEDRFQGFIERIEAEIRREFPDLAALEVKYDPADKEMPLIIVAVGAA